MIKITLKPKPISKNNPFGLAAELAAERLLELEMNPKEISKLLKDYSCTSHSDYVSEIILEGSSKSFVFSNFCCDDFKESIIQILREHKFVS